MLELLFVLPVLLFLTYAAVEFWSLLTLRQQVEDLVHRYLSSAQVEGWFSATDQTALWQDMAAVGCKDTAGGSVVTGTLEGSVPTRVLRPGLVRLEITCAPRVRPLLVGRLIRAGEPPTGFAVRAGGWIVSERVFP